MVCSLPLILLGFMGTVLMVSERRETSLYLSLLSFSLRSLPLHFQSYPYCSLYRIMPAVEQNEQRTETLFIIPATLSHSASLHSLPYFIYYLHTSYNNGKYCPLAYFNFKIYCKARL